MTVNVSIVMKIGYMHAVLTEDGDVLAECGVWHAGEDDECEVAENWVLARMSERVKGCCDEACPYCGTHCRETCSGANRRPFLTERFRF